MKSVIAFIRQWDDQEGNKYFTESATFGFTCKYASAAEFVQSLQKMYRDHGKGNFTIENVVIG